MAVELCSEDSGMSPRISFSHDLRRLDDVVPVEQRPLRSKSSGLNSSIHFDFCVGENFEQEPSSADELFSDGKILPGEIMKKKNVPASAEQTDQSSPPLPLSLPPPTSVVPDDANINENSKKGSSKENKMTRDKTGVEVDDEKQSSKSFWGFKRSSSLNCGSGYGRSLCPLPLLSRSNSTGCTPPNVKQSSISKDSPHNHNHNSQKHTIPSCCKSSTSYQKPPLMKKSYKPYGNGVQVNPVLNVPSGNLFGLGSIFFNGKDKNHKKKK